MKDHFSFPGLAGLVMAGGKSSRMGRDKALLRLDSGPDLLDLACMKMDRLTSFWHVSCARGKTRPGYPCLEDSLEDFGPLAGILEGLENALEHGYASLLVLACDLPLMTVELLARLASLHISTGEKALLAVYQNAVNGILEMQAALYSVKALPFLREAAREGRSRLATLVPMEAQLRLPYPPSLEARFLNCNSPADMEQARKILKNNPDLWNEYT